MKPKNLFVLKWVMLLFFIPAVVTASEYGHQSTPEAWKQEYAEVCGKTQDAMSLTINELKEFIDRCDRLEERLDELGEAGGPERKVYAKRLEMCRELYIFTLEYKEKKE